MYRLATIHSATDGRHYDDNSVLYCVVVSSAKIIDCPDFVNTHQSLSTMELGKKRQAENRATDRQTDRWAVVTAGCVHLCRVTGNTV